MAESETPPRSSSDGVIRGLAFVLVAISALITAFIWILGVGVPRTTHFLMGFLFFAIHAGVVYFIAASPSKHLGLTLLAAALIVPVEIGAIVLLGFAEHTIKYGFKDPEAVCEQQCREGGYKKHRYTAPEPGKVLSGCSCTY
jgi:hypothetical protein